MSDNPYASPKSVGVAVHSEDLSNLTPKDLSKVEAVIKDASQFWLAILLCMFCIGLGAIIVPFWYTARLLQWRGLANRYAELTDPNHAPQSLTSRFQSAKWKLTVGLIAGLIFLGIFGIYFSLLLVMDFPAPN